MTIRSSRLFRKLTILVIDLLAIAWMIHLAAMPSGPDFPIELIFIAFVIGMVIYNVYAVLLARHLHANRDVRFSTELLFVCFLLLPILFLWYILQ